jgi:hypothetical protein
LLALTILALAAVPAAARSDLNDSQVRQIIIRQSIADYQASRGPCPCPYNQMRNGAPCGDHSAYSKPRGATPLCYPADVSDRMVSNWRHGASGMPTVVTRR